MTVSEHLYTVEIVGTGWHVRPTAGSVTLDESWSPYVQASLTIPIPPADVLAALDPRRPGGARVRVTLTQRFGSSEPLSTLSADWSGMTLEDVSALYAGQTLAAISDTYGRPYNASGTQASTVRRLTLHLRARTVRRSTGTVVLDLASDEALLQDLARVDDTPVQPAQTNVRSAVQLVLDEIGATLMPGPDNGTIDPDALFWQPGVSGWNYVSPLVTAAGLRLYCDERRRWHLVKPLAATEGELVIDRARLTADESKLSREGDWYEAVVVTYRWTDSAGTERERHDVAALPDWTRAHHVVHERPWPGPGAAAALLARARARGREDAGTLVSDYTAVPGQRLVFTGDDPAEGLLARVRWDLGTDEMQVRSRDLIEDPNADAPPAA